MQGLLRAEGGTLAQRRAEMRPPEGVLDGHSLVLVGYRDGPAQPGSGVFLIRNSGKGNHTAAMSYE